MGTLVAAPGWAQQPGTQAYVWGCVNESNGLLNNCTANDLTFVQLGLGIQRDGCVNPTDRVKIYLRGALQNTTAQARYDVGIFFPGDDGGVIDPELDGALSGVCSVAGLMNPEPVTPTDACTYDATPGALDLVGGGGPWVNAESAGYNDRCGDIYANASSTACDSYPADGSWDDTIVWIDLPADGIEITCTDDDGAGGSDGFVDLPVCLTWGNQQNQVDVNGDSLCDFNDTLKEIRPGTKSKCRCSMNEPTDIPAPDLGLSCSLPFGATEVQPGGFVQVSISYTNTCTCSPDLATEERFRCCTASYVQFPITYDSTNGTISDISPGTGTAVDDGAGTITWTPETTSLTAGTGVIAQGESSTLTFYYHVNVGAPDPGSTIVSIGTSWSDDPTVDGNGVFTVDPRNQTTLTSQCSFNFDSTWATISNVTAEVKGARTVVSWQSSAEAGSLGFDVYRSGASGDRWVKVNEALLPAIGEGPGGRYQLVDDSAPIEGAVTYKVVEVDAWGRGREAGPVRVELTAGESESPRRDYVAERRRPSARMAAAIERSTPKARQLNEGARPKQFSRRSAPRPTRLLNVKIGISESGLYRVTAAEVAAAMGESEAEIVSLIGRHRLSLSTGGQPVAWRAEPDNRGILFYGQASDTLYDAERTYVLRIGSALLIDEAHGNAPEPVDAPGSFPELVLREENTLLRPFNVIGEDQDFWFWTAVLADDPNFERQQVEFELDDVAESDDTAALTVSFSGFGPVVFAEGSVLVNGHHVGDLWGRTFSPQQTVLEFDQRFVMSGSNTVTFIGLEGGFLVDRLEVSYDRLLRASGGELTVRNPESGEVTIRGFSTSRVDVYDVTDGLRPILVPSATAPTADGSVMVGFSPDEGEGTYLAIAADAVRHPSSIVGRAVPVLGIPSQGADYVVITTGDFLTTAQRLADHRQNQGLEAMVVDIEDIFDEFGFGSRDPMAIRAFLAYASDRWATPPRYVLLAGRGHYDYKDYLGYGGNLLPPALAVTSRGLIPSDNRIADLDGDGLPDLAIGRLPVLNSEELSAAIDKIVAYEASRTGPWAKKVVLAADNPDDAGDFIASSNRLGAAAPPDREIQRVHLSQPYTAEDVHAQLMAGLDEGVGIVNWVGHAGFDSLAHERVLTLSDLPQLASTEHPAFVIGLTCLINNFGLPYFTAFGEELALVPDGGAIGVWAAGGLSDNAVAERLGENFMAALEGDEQRLGDIIQRAFDDFQSTGSNSSISGEYVFFGDPGLLMK